MTIGIGIVAAFCYDYYRELRKAFRLKKFGTFLGDLIYWLVMAVLVFVLLLKANWGEVRMYVFMGLGLGALLYYGVLSKPVSRLVRLKFYVLYRLWKFFVAIIQFIWNAVLFPFRLVIKIIAFPLHYLVLAYKKAGRKLKNFAGGKIKGSTAALKPRLSRLAFWKKKKE